MDGVKVPPGCDKVICWVCCVWRHFLTFDEDDICNLSELRSWLFLWLMVHQIYGSDNVFYLMSGVGTYWCAGRMAWPRSHWLPGRAGRPRLHFRRWCLQQTDLGSESPWNWHWFHRLHDGAPVRRTLLSTGRTETEDRSKDVGLRKHVAFYHFKHKKSQQAHLPKSKFLVLKKLWVFFG